MAGAPRRTPLPRSTKAAPAEAPERRPRVLVVDDEPLVLRSVERLLRQDCEVVVARSAEQALELVETDARFDAILCDLCLGDMSGFDLYDQLPKRLATRVLFVTGDASSKRSREFANAHPDRVLVKPAKPATLRAAVNRVCRQA